MRSLKECINVERSPKDTSTVRGLKKKNPAREKMKGEERENYQ